MKLKLLYYCKMLFLISIVTILISSDEEKEFEQKHVEDLHCWAFSDDFCKWDLSDDKESKNKIREYYDDNCNTLCYVEQCWIDGKFPWEDEYLGDNTYHKKSHFERSNFVKILSKENDGKANGYITSIMRKSSPGFAPDDSFNESIFSIDRSEYFQYYESILYTPYPHAYYLLLAKFAIVKAFSDSKKEEISNFLYYYEKTNFDGAMGVPYSLHIELSKLICNHCKAKNEKCSELIIDSFFFPDPDDDSCLNCLEKLKDVPNNYVTGYLIKKIRFPEKPYSRVIIAFIELDRRDALTKDIVEEIKKTFGEELGEEYDPEIREKYKRIIEKYNK